MKRRNNIIVVTGISASGKDFLLERALATVSDSPPISVLPFGALLSERIRRSTQSEGDRDDLRNAKTELVAKCAREIVEEAVEADVPTVINTHLAYRSNGLVVVNPEMDSIVRPRDYIFVRAKPEDIAQRRLADTTRNREQEGLEALELHQEIALGAVAGIARVLKSGFAVIQNEMYNVERNVATIREIVYG